MDNRLNEYTGAKQDQPSGLPLSEAGTRQAAAAVEGFAVNIHNNAALTLGDMREFTDKLNAAAEVEVGGRRFSVEQVRSDPELRRNITIWQEILSGDLRRYKELTLLTPAVAAALARFRSIVGKGLWLTRLTALDPETAAALAGFRGMLLNLISLTALDPETAKALAQFPGTIDCDPAVQAQIDWYKPKPS